MNKSENMELEIVLRLLRGETVIVASVSQQSAEQTMQRIKQRLAIEQAPGNETPAPRLPTEVIDRRLAFVWPGKKSTGSETLPWPCPVGKQVES